MSQSYYFQLQAIYPPTYIEQIEDIGFMALQEFGCQGVEEFSLDEPRVDEILGERSYSGGDLPLEVLNEVEEVTLHSSSNQLSYYFYGDEAEELAKQFQEFLQLNFPETELNLLKKEQEDWNQEWKKHYKPIWVDQKLEIVPSFFQDYQSQADNKILIEPGMGFGTGSHETTYLCLKLFCSLKKNFQDVLDFGCGSGILGLAVGLLEELKTLDLYDIDPEALNNARVNLKLNGVKENYTRFMLPEGRSSFLPEYDLVFANILLPVLKEERDNLIQLTKLQGQLILSGILNEQKEELKSYYLATGKVKLLNEFSQNDWAAVMFERI